MFQGRNLIVMWCLALSQLCHNRDTTRRTWQNCDTPMSQLWHNTSSLLRVHRGGRVILHPKNLQNQKYLKCPPLNFESWFRSPRHTILTTGYYCDNLLSLNISILSQSTQNALHQYVNTNLLIFLQTVFPITYVYWHIENMGRVDWKINI